MSKVVYTWRGSKGLMREASSAQIVGNRLTEIENKYGHVDPRRVVEDARPINSPLHRYFEWNDVVAAEGYRLGQARQLISSVHVQIIDDKKLVTPIRAFVNLLADDTESGNREYQGITRVMANVNTRQILLDKAKRELEEWQKRYRDLQEFSDVFDAIAKVPELEGV